MFIYIILFTITTSQSHSINDSPCSREQSRIVRRYVELKLLPIYDRFHVSIPDECIFSHTRDIFYKQESNRVKINENQWMCQYCQRMFSSEHNLDLHLNYRHNDTLNINEQTVCLADYCSIFRCEVLKQSKNFHPRTHQSSSNYKKYVNAQQLTILRTRCASVINQCIPDHIHFNARTELQHAMYAELCAYLTVDRYFRLPDNDKLDLSWTILLLIITLISIALLAIKFVRRLKEKSYEQDDEEFEKPLSDETISTATALLSRTPTNGIIHLSKPSPTIRHRVRFRSFGENPSESS